MLLDVPILLQVMMALAVMVLVVGAMWSPASSFAVRWPAVTASALFFGFLVSSMLLSDMIGSASLMLIVSSLIFLSVTSLLMLTSQAAGEDTHEDKEHQQ